MEMQIEKGQPLLVADSPMVGYVIMSKRGLFSYKFPGGKKCWWFLKKDKELRPDSKELIYADSRTVTGGLIPCYNRIEDAALQCLGAIGKRNVKWYLIDSSWQVVKVIIPAGARYMPGRPPLVRFWQTGADRVVVDHALDWDEFTRAVKVHHPEIKVIYGDYHRAEDVVQWP